MNIPTLFNIEIAGRKIAFSMHIDVGNSADINTLHGVKSQGCCEPEIAHVMARVVKPGDRAIDVGANIGFFTLLLSQLVGENGSVLAFEPAPVQHFKLRENIKLNHANSIIPIQAALWEKVEEVTLHLGMDGGQHSIKRSAASIGRVKVQATTFDRAVPNPRFKLMKVDVEGAEEHILYGAREMNSTNIPYVVSELNDEALRRFNTNGEQYRQCMAQRGYQTFLLHENGSLPCLVPEKTKLVQGMNQNVNVLFSTIDRVVEAWPKVQL